VEEANIHHTDRGTKGKPWYETVATLTPNERYIARFTIQQKAKGLEIYKIDKYLRTKFFLTENQLEAMKKSILAKLAEFYTTVLEERFLQLF